ncbi:cytochrome C oxidase assembly protein [Acidithiobacillus caldus]
MSGLTGKALGPPLPHAVDGELTGEVRAIGWLFMTLLLMAALAGLWKGVTCHQGEALVNGLKVSQVGFAMTLILLGSIVEGFGYGLSLGTRWPYTRNIVALMLRGDPEAAHRVVATLVGLVALALATLSPSVTTISGLSLVVITALFGMGTLHVLAGRAPAFVHGTHGLLAYSVFLTYLTNLVYPGLNFWTFLYYQGALHALLLAVLLGGMTTGQRGFGTAIGSFVQPRKASHWTVAAHVTAALVLVATLGWMMPAFPVAFYLAVAQVAVGFVLFHAVNLRPKNPGAMVAFHQTMVLLISLAIVLQWR